MIRILDILASASLDTVDERNVSLVTSYLILWWGRVYDEVEHSEHDEQISGVGQVEGDRFDEGPAEDLLRGGEAHPDIDSCSYCQNHQVVHKEQVKVPVSVPLAVETA